MSKEFNNQCFKLLRVDQHVNRMRKVTHPEKTETVHLASVCGHRDVTLDAR